MQDQLTKHKKVFPGRLNDEVEDGWLLSKVQASDKYKEDSRMYRRTIFDQDDW